MATPMHHLIAPSAVAAGIDPKQWAAEFRAGNEWCRHKKHFVPSKNMTGHCAATCRDCARDARAARKARKQEKRTA